MNILLLSNFYPPEVRSISTMMAELAHELRRRGHSLTVMTNWPRENIASESVTVQLRGDDDDGGIRVIRVQMPYGHRENYLWRGLSHLLLPFYYWRAFQRYRVESPDAVIVYSPHLPLTIMGEWVKRCYHARYLLNIQDIFPQNAIDLGIMRSSIFIRLFEWMEARAYRTADAITTHTDGGWEFLIKNKGVPKSKIHIVYNWIDPAPFVNAQHTGRFRRQYQLGDQFVFLFPGIFGPSQDLDFLLEVARGVSDIPDIHFLFVGEGTEKERIITKAAAWNLHNIQFEPLVSSEEYPELLKEVNVGLLCLSAKNKTAVVPGKLLGFMAASLPVVAFLQPQSDGHRMIKSAQCGYSIVSDDVEVAISLVRQMFQERGSLALLGKNGYNNVVSHFSKEHCISQLERLATNDFSL